MSKYEVSVLIVGGGFAGLNAALNVARTKMSVLVVNGGKPRNSVALESHGVLTRDGSLSAEELLKASRNDVKKYSAYVTILDEMKVETVEKVAEAPLKFRATLSDSSEVIARRIILATGVKDNLPQVEGLEALWGVRAHNCVYCDAYEYGDKPLALISSQDRGNHIANTLTQWTKEVHLFVDEAVAKAGLPLHPKIKVHPFPSKVFWSGAVNDPVLIYETNDSAPIEVGGVFVTSRYEPQTKIAEQLGATLHKGFVLVDAEGISSVPGLAAVGDVSWPQNGNFSNATISMAIGSSDRAAKWVCNGIITEDVQNAIKNSTP